MTPFIEFLFVVPALSQHDVVDGCETKKSQSLFCWHQFWHASAVDTEPELATTVPARSKLKS
jgi:hypothetical protein